MAVWLQKQRLLKPEALWRESMFQVQIKRNLIFYFNTPTMYQPQWQSHINQAHERITYKVQVNQDFQRLRAFPSAGQCLLTTVIKSSWKAGIIRTLLGEQVQLGRWLKLLCLRQPSKIHVPLFGQFWNSSDVSMLF